MAYEAEMAFIRKECAIWGEDYIYGLIDEGYEVVYIPELSAYRFMLASDASADVAYSTKRATR